MHALTRDIPHPSKDKAVFMQEMNKLKETHNLFWADIAQLLRLVLGSADLNNVAQKSEVDNANVTMCPTGRGNFPFREEDRQQMY